MGNAIAVPTNPSNCRIVIVAPNNGEASLSELRYLPPEAVILGTGNSLEELQKNCPLFTEANVLLNVSGNAESLTAILEEMPFIKWIHSITAGVDHMLCAPMFYTPDLILTNAKGVYGESLAEYVIGAIMYFAKHFQRLEQQKLKSQWLKFDMKEIRGTTMGIIGYGDIGAECAKVAKVFGMRIVALRKRPDLCQNDPFVDKALGQRQLNDLMAMCDYVVVTAALTNETRGMIDEDAFKHSKPGQIIINIARGPIIVESALIKALTTGQIAGAALDVFDKEPLPPTSILWKIPNILISPHNADQLVDSRHKSVHFFTENCKRFLKNEQLERTVSLVRGY